MFHMVANKTYLLRSHQRAINRHGLSVRSVRSESHPHHALEGHHAVKEPAARSAFFSCFVFFFPHPTRWGKPPRIDGCLVCQGTFGFPVESPPKKTHTHTHTHTSGFSGDLCFSFKAPTQKNQRVPSQKTRLESIHPLTGVSPKCSGLPPDDTQAGGEGRLSDLI